MTELDDYMLSVNDKSKITIKNYKSQYNKLRAYTGKDIANTSELKLIQIINENENNLNSKQALINIGIQVRRLNHFSVDKLELERDKNKTALIGYIKNKNIMLQDTLPSYAELINYVEELYQSSNWKKYIINYLLINYQVRNLDLNFQIVKLKRDTTDTTHNYLWLSPTKCSYIRNIYKTAGSYGKKIINITDPKFITSVRRYSALLKHGEIDALIPNDKQLGYYIQNMSYKGLGEGNVLKVIINHYINDVAYLKQISQNRGTDMNVLLENYNITNV